MNGLSFDVNFQNNKNYLSRLYFCYLLLPIAYFLLINYLHHINHAL